MVNEKQGSNQNAEARPGEAAGRGSRSRKSSLSLIVIALVFIAFLAIVFITQNRAQINWTSDYNAALKIAAQQNKPLLLAFYKRFTPYCSNMEQHTLKDPEVIRFIETNFVPVLIDVDEQPKLAAQYNVGYYPSHYIRHPLTEKVVGPHMGYDVPSEFIRKITALLGKLNSTED